MATMKYKVDAEILSDVNRLDAEKTTDGKDHDVKNSENGKIKFSPGTKSDPHRGYRIAKHVLLLISMVSHGMSLEVIGPTMTDIKDRLDITYSQLSSALVCRGLGTFAGKVFAGFILGRFQAKSDGIYGVALVSFGILTALIPNSGWLTLAMVIFFCCGFAEGIVDTAYVTIMLEIWMHAAAVPLYSGSLLFGLGGAITPQLVRPFLSPEAAHDDLKNYSVTNDSTERPDVTTAIFEDLSRVEIPYMIIGIIVAILGLIFIGLQLKGLPEEFEMKNNRNTKVKYRDMINPAVCGMGNFKYGLELLICMFFYYVLMVGFGVCLRFLFAFSTESIVNFTKAEATNLVTIFFACALAMRGVSVILAKFIPINIFMIINLVLILAVSIIMVLYAHYVRWVLWTSAAILGVLGAPLWPNGTAWANRYLHMNSMGVMVLQMGESTGYLAVLPIIGRLFDINSRYLTYVIVGCACSLVCLSGVMNVILRFHKKDDFHDHDRGGIDGGGIDGDDIDRGGIDRDGIDADGTDSDVDVNVRKDGFGSRTTQITQS